MQKDKSDNFITSNGSGIESPFLIHQEFSFSEIQTEAEGSEGEPMLNADSEYEDSPFHSYMQEGELEYEDQRSEEIASFISELYDEEFDELLQEMVQEASTLYEKEMSNPYYGNPRMKRRQAVQEVEAAFSPLSQELTHMFDQMIQDAQDTEWEQMTEEEIDNWVEERVGDTEFENDIFEHGFLKRLRRKAKNLRKKLGRKIKKGFRKIKKAVKKGAKWVGKKLKQAFLFALRKLRKHAKGLLKHVLKMGIDRLPPEYREYAKLAKKALFKEEVAEELYADSEYDTDLVGELQFEFNLQMAEMIYGNGMDEELEMEEETAEYEMETLSNETGSVDQFHEARERFVQQISQLKENEDPTPYIEEFIPVILQGLRIAGKIAIKVAGRPKVVKYLAKYVGKILAQFLKGDKFKRIMPLLSYAATDVGLRLAGLEISPEEQENAAGHAIAGIVEDTVKELSDLPEHLLDDQEILEGHVLEAFEQAVTSNLPPILSEEVYRKRPYLRESRLKGGWLRLPFKKGRRKRLKKFSQTSKVRLTPHLARRIKTFEGNTLAEHLSEQMGLPLGEEMEAIVHLYEILPGSDLSDIAAAESELAHTENDGGGSLEQLHPLTTENAGLLLNEPGLGRDVEEEYLVSRRKVKPGQRFMRIQVPRARLKQMTDKNDNTRHRRLTRAHISLDFVRNQLTIRFFLSEANAQEISSSLRMAKSGGMAVSKLLSKLGHNLKTALSPAMRHRRKIVHGKVMPGLRSAAAMKRFPTEIQEHLMKNILMWSAAPVKEFMKQNTSAWMTAAEDDMDGVTLTIVMEQVPGFKVLKQFLQNQSAPLSPKIFTGKPEAARVSVKAGYDND